MLPSSPSLTWTIHATRHRADALAIIMMKIKLLLRRRRVMKRMPAATCRVVVARWLCCAHPAERLCLDLLDGAAAGGLLGAQAFVDDG
eukprot:COSAG06_NODE_18098_length_904_cov_1.091925_1_plen_88_part_00